MDNMVEKLAEFQKKLQNEEYDAFLITSTINSYYFTDFFSLSNAYFVVYPEGTPKLLLPELEYENAKKKVKNSEILKLDRNMEVYSVIKGFLEEKKVKTLGFEETSMNVSTYLDISKKFDFLQLKQGSKLIEDLRTTKTKEELNKIKKACKIADKGLAVLHEIISEEKTEIEVAAEIEYEMRKQGADSIAFDTIVASGYRSAFPHGISTNKMIKKNELIIIDLGAKVEGYCSDMTRTVVFGAPNPRQLEIYNLVLRVQQETIEACQQGRNAVDMDEYARNAFSEKGYGKYFVHSLGHGVGLEVHEPPALAIRSKDVLKEGNVFTIEPGIYIPDFGGVRIEDTVYLSENKAEILTKSDYSIQI